MKIGYPAFAGAVSFACLLFSGCTYQAAAISTAAPTSEIRTDRFRDAHVAVVNNVSETALKMEARKSSFTCSAHTYPIDIGPALRGTIGNVMEASFRSYELIDSQVNVSPGQFDYVFVFDFSEFDATVGIDSGFWEATANGTADVTLRVQVLGATGEELIRTNVGGDGNAQAKGGCDKGAVALGEAGSEAVSETLETFVHKVINSDQLDLGT